MKVLAMDALRNLMSRIVVRFRPYPYTIALPQTGFPPLRFMIHNPVERYRTVEYGGERVLWQALLQQLQPQDIFFDIGASVGLMALGAARICKQVYAFEPDPETRASLQTNVELNRLTNVSVVSWAVSDRSGEVQLYSDGAAGFAPTLIKQPRPNAPSDEIRVTTHTLDDAIESGDLPLPTVIKIDIEGAEILCLRGARRMFSGEFGEPPRLMVIEVHPEFLSGFSATVADVEALIDSEIYELFDAQERDAQEHHWYRRRDASAG